MVAKDFNGNIKTYRRLPNVWEDDKGLHLNFRKSNYNNYGFYDVVRPAYDSITQRLGSIEFDSSKKIFTYPIIDIDLESNNDIDELKSSKRREVNEKAGVLLKDTDWYVIRKAERGVDIPAEVIEERSSIVSKADSLIVEINELTTVESVLRYSFSYNPEEENPIE